MCLQLGIISDICVLIVNKIAEEKFNIIGIKLLLTIDVFKYIQYNGNSNLYIEMVYACSLIKLLKITFTKIFF